MNLHNINFFIHEFLAKIFLNALALFGQSSHRGFIGNISYLYPKISEELSGLTIYKASAGSGKTFTITREYIRLLFRDTDNYRHILGVTFTNKATAEMKNRIIAELYKLSVGEKSSYAQDLMETYHLSPAVLKQRASLILSKILHDYSRFTILTIDSFFQRVIRTFAREVGFYQGFDIELDQENVLSKSVDQMIFELEADSQLLCWLVSFAEEKIIEGSSWNINRDIEKLGREVFKESFKEVSDQLIHKITDKGFLENFSKQLNLIRIDFEQKLQTKGKNAVEILKNHGLTNDDLKGKSRCIGALFDKIAGSEKFDDWKITDTNRRHLNELTEWIPVNSLKAKVIESAFHSGLNRLLGEIIDIYDHQLPFYLSVLAVQKHLYVLGVITDLLVHIHEYTSGKNLFLISDTAEFLKRLIQGSDTPFIFERIGAFIRHFMIDEFQDTSALQWFNFRPLIINSLAEDNENWIVGDVKQSIYRWRNSDWTILSEKITNDLKAHHINVENLQYNWRSSFNIVSFNNSFFQNAIQILLQEVTDPENALKTEGYQDCESMLQKAYSDFAQIVPEHKMTNRGLVEVKVIPKSEDKTISFEMLALERLKVIIESLQDNHYNLKDIAILIRERREGELIADYLLKCRNQEINRSYKYDVLSNDSLMLKNSEAVKWIISVLTYIISPSDRLNQAFLLYEFQQYLELDAKKEANLDVTFSAREAVSLPGKLGTFFQQEFLSQYSVYELCDKIISYFELTKLTNELPFIQAFQDMLHDYSLKEPVDLSSFLQWWEEKQDKFLIRMPDDQDAMRLMTFHSAKGLEFKVVIMPFASWDFMKSGWNGNILWCRTNVEPFNRLDLLPVSLTKGLQNTIFSREYFHEKALSMVDNLNLLYVAFTRAIDALYVTVPEPSKDEIENNIGNLIARAVKNQLFNSSQSNFPTIRITDYWNSTDTLFRFGELPSSTKKTVESDYISLEGINYTVRSIADVVSQVISSGNFFSEEGEALKSRLSTGKIMHEVFQRIKTPEDIEGALAFLLMEGKISEADIRHLSANIKELIGSTQVSEWFSSGWQIKTEADILLKDGTLPRPDRVMIKGDRAIVIDYKFGETEHSSHQWQVRKYMQYMHHMGYKSVEGFLWYVQFRKVVPVKLEPVQGKLF